jgi:hypothetical protein
MGILPALSTGAGGSYYCALAKNLHFRAQYVKIPSEGKRQEERWQCR